MTIYGRTAVPLLSLTCFLLLLFFFPNATPLEAMRMQILPQLQDLQLHHRERAGSFPWRPRQCGDAYGEGRNWHCSYGTPQGLRGGGCALQEPLAFLRKRPDAGLSPRCLSKQHAARKAGPPSGPRRRKQPEVHNHDAAESSRLADPRSAALSLRMGVLRKAKEAEEERNAFPIALRLPHPELVAGKIRALAV